MFRPATAVLLALTAGLLGPTEVAAADRTIHSFVADRARAHRFLDGYRVFVPGAGQSKALRTPRTRGLDYTLPTPHVQAVHVRIVPEGKGRPRVRVTLGRKVNVPFPKLDAGAGSRTVTGHLRAPLPQPNRGSRPRCAPAGSRRSSPPTLRAPRRSKSPSSAAPSA